MIPTSEILLAILSLALTTAALTLPAISIAYFLVIHTEEEETEQIKRFSKIIGYGSLSALFLVGCSIFTFIFICLGHENETEVLAISSALFLIGCFLLLYVLLIISGFKREIPIPKSKPTQAREDISVEV